MTFTIPPFWCGVIATIACELIALIIAAVVKNNTKKKQTKYKIK